MEPADRIGRDDGAEGIGGGGGPLPLPCVDGGSSALEGAPATPSALGHDELGPVDPWRQWGRLLAYMRRQWLLDALQDPPDFHRISRCTWRVPKPPLRELMGEGVGKRSHAAVMEDGGVEDRCECAHAAVPCDETCINRMIGVECTAHNCSYGGDASRRCTNRAMSRRQGKRVVPLPTPGMGWGLFACEPIAAGDYVLEYVGEVMTDRQMARRLEEMKAAGHVHVHMMMLTSDLVIDAGQMGNESRFINHSCAPNCGAMKRTVGSEVRVGIFALNDIAPGTELTYDYDFESFGTMWECQCGAPTCRRFLGVNKNRAQQAAVLEAAGVATDMTAAVARESTPAASRDVGGKAARAGRGGSGKRSRYVPGHPMRGQYSLAPLNPTVFHQHTGAAPPPSRITQLVEGICSVDDEGWARQQRLFVVGARPQSATARLTGDAAAGGRRKKAGADSAPPVHAKPGRWGVHRTRAAVLARE